WLAKLRAEHTRLADGRDAATSRGHLTGDPDAWRDAVIAFDYGAVYEQALARWRYADALLAVGDREIAAKELDLAHEVADRLGAVPLRDALRTLAKRGRLAVSWSTGAVSSGVDPLTPRERSVLTLVAEGKTNREVGDVLYISEKTVSVHLSRAMAKLGATRRAEAVATAYDRGLLSRQSPS
ncbi:MAG: helix-turn-helix transcriptional regulator, partial [Sciscionella sp.]|nr:helix-turn-helix transcriptional regulator [Sciscionella sp.]